MRNRHRHNASPVERLRLAIDCLPVGTREAMKENDLIEPVEEFRPKMAAYRFHHLRARVFLVSRAFDGKKFCTEIGC